jgi:N-acetylneuraminic acid mutarotase
MNSEFRYRGVARLIGFVASLTAGVTLITGKGGDPPGPSACTPAVAKSFAPVTASGGLLYADLSDGGGTGGGGGGDGGGGVGGGAALGATTNAVVTVERADGKIVGTATTDEFGMVTIRNCGDTQPLLVTVEGAEGATYWDEALSARVPMPPGLKMRVMVASEAGDATLVKNIGVTPLTEAAYQYAVAQLGGESAWKTAANVTKANRDVTAEFNRVVPTTQAIEDPTRLPAMARDASSQVFAATTANATYGLVMAGLVRAAIVHNAGSVAPALDLKRQLALDLADGRFDGFAAGNVPVAPSPTQQAYVFDKLPTDLLQGMQKVAATNGTTRQFETFTLSGSVTNLRTAGLVLANRAGSGLTIASGATSFSFGPVLVVGADYDVTVLAQPLGQVCTVTNGRGTAAGAANVASPAVFCTTTTVPVLLGGSVIGLSAGGLVLANGPTTVAVPANATSFTFGSILQTGGAYSVTVQTQPAGLSCAVTNGSGTAGTSAITAPAVTCTPSVVPRFTLSGSVTGLSAPGLVLSNGTPTVTVAAGATSFTFGSVLVAGSSYNVAVRTQPTGQTCSMEAGSGTAGSANVSSLVVACVVTSDRWTWLSGSSTVNQPGIYGTRGVASAANVPGARDHAVSWTDTAGNLWLFGGYRRGLDASRGSFNDLWRYNPTAGTWTWINGSSTTGETGIYGSRGVASATNVPGARDNAVSWADAAGNLWLFGGNGFDGDGGITYNDLWRYSPTAGTWVWVSGGSTANNVGIYGTRGVASATNVPGARSQAVSWTGADGDLWLFGGFGYDAGGNSGSLNDLWRYSPTTGLWTWVSGSSIGNANAGVYGTRGVASAINVPGARWNAVSWTDVAGNLWLFGGDGFDRDGVISYNDLWRYSPTAGTWVWVSGGSTANNVGIYGTRGVASAVNVPGARGNAASWTDDVGNLWLFGGNQGIGNFNDLWQYSPTAGTWTWVSGGFTTNTAGIYGASGVASVANVPGARNGAVSWTDATGNLWLFGGTTFQPGDNINFNDLWRYRR